MLISQMPTRKNLAKWGIISSPDCSFCLCPETLTHVVAGCQSYLERFTWRHDSVLNFLAQTLSGGSSVSQNKLPQLILGYIYILKYLQSSFIG